MLTVNIYETYVEILDFEGNVIVSGATPEHFQIAYRIQNAIYDEQIEGKVNENQNTK
jgi:hypothetical protein